MNNFRKYIILLPKLQKTRDDQKRMIQVVADPSWKTENSYKQTWKKIEILAQIQQPLYTHYNTPCRRYVRDRFSHFSVCLSVCPAAACNSRTSVFMQGSIICMALQFIMPFWGQRSNTGHESSQSSGKNSAIKGKHMVNRASWGQKIKDQEHQASQSSETKYAKIDERMAMPSSNLVNTLPPRHAIPHKLTS